jgi:hypothetical protein
VKILSTAGAPALAPKVCLAVLNVAAGTAPEDHYQSFFLNLVDSFTPTHLLMLAQFNLQTPVKIVESPDWLKSNVSAQTAKDLLDRGLLGYRAWS